MMVLVFIKDVLLRTSMALSYEVIYPWELSKRGGG